METLLDIDERDLDEMGIPKGFSIKLLKRIQQEKHSLEALHNHQEDVLTLTLSKFVGPDKQRFNNFIGFDSGHNYLTEITPGNQTKGSLSHKDEEDSCFGYDEELRD